MIRVPARAAGQTAGGFLTRCGLLACVLTCLAFVAPGSALADGLTPAVTTNATALATNATTELVSGTINPHGLSTTYTVEYALKSSTWCGGTGSSNPTTAPGPDQLNYYDSNFDPASFSLSGLTPGTAYCAELTATNAGTNPGQGTTQNTPVDFTAGVPTVVTGSPTTTGDQQATIPGTIDPASQATTYRIEYTIDPPTAPAGWCSDPTTAPTGESSSPITTMTATDALAHDVTSDIDSANLTTPLQPATQYCAAIVATNGSGSSVSSNTPTVTFTTDAAAALSSSTPPQSTSATSMQVTGTINPDGVSTQYYVAYGQVGTDFCQGLGGTPAYTTAPAQLGAQDQSGHSVTVNITQNLSPGVTYCVALVAQNQPFTQLPNDPQGLSYSSPLDITAGLPTADTTAQAFIDTASSAQLTGTVDPAGQATTYRVEYALRNSEWCVSGGTQGTPTNPTGTGVALSESAAGTYDVTSELTGLTPGTAYCAAIAANNSSNGQNSSPLWSTDVAPTNGSIAPVDFIAGVVPTVGTASASDETASSTSVSATVNPQDQSTSYVIGYDVAGSQFCQDPANQIPSNTAPTTPPTLSASFTVTTVNASLTGLASGQSYCAAVIATNGSGQATGTPTSFIAGQPSVSSVSTPAPASATAETLTGTIDPTGQPSTQYYVAYDTADSSWCNPLDDNSSPTGASFSTTPLTLGASDSVSVTFGNLAPGDQYCAELFAATPTGNPANPVNYSVALPAQTFTAGYPFTVSTTGTGAVGASSTVVTGTVNPAGLPTTYGVAYDLAGSDWCSSGGTDGVPTYSTTPVTLPAQDTQDHDVSVGVGGLSPNTPYCAEIVANNDMGASDGAQVSFTTATAPVVSPPTTGAGGSPSRTIGAPSNLALRSASASPRGAVADATIDPGGQATSYHAVYAPASARFCVSDGRTGRASSTASTRLPFADFSPHTVSVSLAKLTPATRYCVQIVAQNASGTTRSALTIVVTVGAPRLTGLRLTQGRFSRSAGTHISFRISQAATVTFTVIALPDFPGARAATVGHFTRVVRAGGGVRFTFTGRVGRRRLRPGGYLLQAVATDRWRQSGTRRSVGFIIVA